MLDVKQNRKSKKYSPKENTLRVLWAVFFPIFRFSPRICFGWRCFLLKLFGAKVGKHVHVYNTAIIYMPWNFEAKDWSSVGEGALIYSLGKIVLGEAVTISHRAHLCAGTHDYHLKNLPLVKLPVKVCSQAWICADSFIGPGVTIGEGAVVGARAVVTTNVEPWAVVAGNPAKKIKTRVVNANL